MIPLPRSHGRRVWAYNNILCLIEMNGEEGLQG